LLHESLYAADVWTDRCKTSLQVPGGRGSVSKDDVKRNVFRCFAPVEYILLKNNDILQSVCELERYVRSTVEPNN